MTKLEEVLSNVPGSYVDFVDGVCSFAERFDCASEIIEYVEGNKEATTSDVIRHMHQLP